MLIKCFEKHFGIQGKALDWLKSYLTGRTQRVVINASESHSVDIDCGFPQGANLAGLLYNMNTAPLQKVVERHPVEHKGFADDNGFYIAFTSVNENEALNSLHTCLTDSNSWFVENNFKVNDGKTKLMYFTPKREFNPSYNFTIGSKIIKPSKSIKSLGVVLDQQLNMENRISTVTKSVYFYTRNISKIRPYLSLNTAKTLVQALVISRLDFSNSLLGNLPLRLINKLKKAQYAAARMLYKKGRRSHMTPVLRKLHWLPVAYRIKFKILLFTFKCLNNSAPHYLKQLLNPYIPCRNLRSNNIRQHTLIAPRFKRRKFGGRAFSRIAPILWNALPVDIRTANSVSQFKSKLKTHYFSLHFFVIKPYVINRTILQYYYMDFFIANVTSIVMKL